MIITTQINDPYDWHPFFAILPVQVNEEIQYVDGRTTMFQTKAILQRVERKLERNLSGTEKWLFRLPPVIESDPLTHKPRWFDSKK